MQLDWPLHFKTKEVSILLLKWFYIYRNSPQVPKCRLLIIQEHLSWSFWWVPFCLIINVLCSVYLIISQRLFETFYHWLFKIWQCLFYYINEISHTSFSYFVILDTLYWTFKVVGTAVLTLYQLYSNLYKCTVHKSVNYSKY